MNFFNSEMLLYEEKQKRKDSEKGKKKNMEGWVKMGVGFRTLKLRSVRAPVAATRVILSCEAQ